MLNYPIAANAREALRSDAMLARTKRDAQNLSEDVEIEMATEWISVADLGEAVFEQIAERSVQSGFGQVYRALDGTPTLAITFWKIRGKLERGVETQEILVPERPIRSKIRGKESVTPPRNNSNQLELF